MMLMVTNGFLLRLILPKALNDCSLEDDTLVQHYLMKSCRIRGWLSPKTTFLPKPITTATPMNLREGWKESTVTLELLETDLG